MWLSNIGCAPKFTPFPHQTEVTGGVCAVTRACRFGTLHQTGVCSPLSNMHMHAWASSETQKNSYTARKKKKTTFMENAEDHPLMCCEAAAMLWCSRFEVEIIYGGLFSWGQRKERRKNIWETSSGFHRQHSAGRLGARAPSLKITFRARRKNV